MTGPENVPTDQPFVWRGVLDPDLLFDDDVSASHECADAAKAADWATVFELLDDDELHVDINGWRPGGTTWFTVLHQAAWHGAPNEVAAELIRRGALKSLTDARGRTAYDVRRERDLKAVHPKDIAAQQRKSLILRTRYLKPPPSPWGATKSARSSGTSPKSSTAASAACSTTAAIPNASCDTLPWRSCMRCRACAYGSPCPGCTGGSTSRWRKTISM